MRRDAAKAGALAGLPAGAAMMLALMGWSASLGQGFWTPLQLVGGSLLGLRAVLGGFAAGALGAALHLATAAAWGAGFGCLLNGQTAAAKAFWAGLAYGAAVWAVMTWVGLPVLDRTLLARVGLMEAAWFCAHLVYGAALCAAPALARRAALTRGARLPAPSAAPGSASRSAA